MTRTILAEACLPRSEQVVSFLRHRNLQIVVLTDAKAAPICYHYVYTNQQAGST
jgi:hypothetical protein